MRGLPTGKPLALYAFSRDAAFCETIRRRTTSGALSINPNPNPNPNPKLNPSPNPNPDPNPNPNPDPNPNPNPRTNHAVQAPLGGRSPCK